jgi:RNA polymerase sigma factor (sigma-70 family)
MNHLHCNPLSRDDDYLREIKAGGDRAEAAITCLYKKYRKRAFAYTKKLISKHFDFKGSAEDLVHDSFIILIQKIQYESMYSKSLSSFWMGIIRYLFLNQLKKDERITLVRESEEMYGLDENTPETIFLQAEEMEQMEYTFSRLGPRCREILMLWIRHYTMTEIAEQVHLSNDAMARKMKHQCFQKLKELVKTGNKMPW